MTDPRRRATIIAAAWIAVTLSSCGESGTAIRDDGPGPGDASGADTGSVDATGRDDAAVDAGCTPFSFGGRGWSRATINVIGGAPIYPDLTMGPDDQPVVVFRKGSSTARWAVVSWFDGAAWSTTENVEQVEGIHLGYRPSVAVAADGTVSVLAYDEDAMRPRLSTRAPGGGWSTEAIYEAGVDAGDHSALVLDATGQLHATFTEYGTYRIIYGVRGAGGWTFEAVAQEGTPVRGASSSLAVAPDGTPHVAYYTGVPDQQLHYAVRGNAAWSVETVDPTVDTGHYPSLVVTGAGGPHIAALRWPDEVSEIRVATRGSSGWEVDTVDTGLGISYTTGMVELSCGGLAVAYARNEGTGGDGLWLAHQAPGSSEWRLLSVDASTYVSGIDLVVGRDRSVHVVYLDETNYLLKHAWLP